MAFRAASRLACHVGHASAGIAAATLLVSSLAAPRLVEPAEPTREQAPQGVVWVGTGPTVDVEELARRAAPILWFSPDEPLLYIDPTAPRFPGARRASSAPVLARRPLPEPLPVVGACPLPTPGEPGTTYFRVDRILRRNDSPAYVPPATDRDAGQIVLANAEWVRLRYLFYYSEDIGTNWHHHDLEGADAILHVEQAPDSGSAPASWRVRLDRMNGLAHGSSWTANRLDLNKPDPEKVPLGHRAVFPLTLLVEDGKHASCPDRSGDGSYTPGYDVNVFLNDSWGVRDNFGSRVLRTQYTADMTKPRRAGDRVGPCAATAAVQEGYTGTLPWPDQCYEIVPWYRVDVSNVDPQCPQPRACSTETPLARKVRAGTLEQPNCLALIGKLKENRVDRPLPVEKKTKRHRLRELRTGLNQIGPESFSGAVRYDGGWVLTTGLLFHPLGLLDGWLSLHVSVRLTEELGFDQWEIRQIRPEGAFVQFAPSASRWLDWYLRLGVGRNTDALRRREDEGDWRFVPETGVKFRYTCEGCPTLFKFLGLRIGVWADGLPDVRRARLIAEFGYGAF